MSSLRKSFPKILVRKMTIHRMNKNSSLRPASVLTFPGTIHHKNIVCPSEAALQRKRKATHIFFLMSESRKIVSGSVVNHKQMDAPGARSALHLLNGHMNCYTSPSLGSCKRCSKCSCRHTCVRCLDARAPPHRRVG